MKQNAVVLVIVCVILSNVEDALKIKYVKNTQANKSMDDKLLNNWVEIDDFNFFNKQKYTGSYMVVKENRK